MNIINDYFNFAKMKKIFLSIICALVCGVCAQIELAVYMVVLGRKVVDAVIRVEMSSEKALCSDIDIFRH